jgi:hypothetical protein
MRRVQIPCHDDPKKGDCKGKQCFIHLHNDMRFRLGKLDCALVKKDKKNWEEPTEDEIRENGLTSRKGKEFCRTTNVGV